MLTVACCAGFTALAQQMNVTGTVTDQAGMPIIGAVVHIEGGTSGTTTDENGGYAIEAPADGTLNVSIIGYKSRQVPVNGRAVIDIVLEEDTQLLDEVIVVAFGTAKKEAFTGSATVIKSDDISKTQQANVAQSLPQRGQ